MYLVYSTLHPFFHLLIHIHSIKQQFQQHSLQVFNDRIIIKYCKNWMQQLLRRNFQYHLGICLTGLTTSWNVGWSWPRYKPRTLATHLTAVFSHIYFDRRVICSMVTELSERTSTMWVRNRSACKSTRCDATYLNHLHNGIHDRRNVLCLHVIQVAAHVQMLDGFIFANCSHYRCQICIHVCNTQTFIWTLNLLLYVSRQPHTKSAVTVCVLKKCDAAMCVWACTLVQCTADRH